VRLVSNEPPINPSHHAALIADFDLLQQL